MVEVKGAHCDAAKRVYLVVAAHIEPDGASIIESAWFGRPDAEARLGELRGMIDRAEERSELWRLSIRTVEVGRPSDDFADLLGCPDGERCL